MVPGQRVVCQVAVRDFRLRQRHVQAEIAHALGQDGVLDRERRRRLAQIVSPCEERDRCACGINVSSELVCEQTHDVRCQPLIEQKPRDVARVVHVLPQRQPPTRHVERLPPRRPGSPAQLLQTHQESPPLATTAALNESLGAATVVDASDNHA